MEELAKQVGSTGATAITLALLCWRVWKLEVERERDSANLWGFLNGSNGNDGLTQRVSRLEAFHESHQ